MDIESVRRVRKLAEEIGQNTAAPAYARQLGTLLAEMADVLCCAEDTLTTAQACERLDLAPGAVRQLVRRGRLTARHEGRELRITRESVEAFAVDRRPRKKPKNNL